MCRFYNEGHKSCTDRWVEQFISKFGYSPTGDDFELLKEFSIDYSTFLETAFPKLTSQLDLLTEAVEDSVSKGKPVRIRTIDGCLLEWDFDNVAEKKKNYYNPVSHQHDQYKVNVTDSNSKKKPREGGRLTRHKRSFMPNLIHSIDGSIMRCFITKYYEYTKRRLNHLHDCVCIHPNHVDKFYDIVTEVYCKEEMRTLARDLVFSDLIRNSVEPQTSKLIDLLNEFESNMDDFELSVKTFNPRKCYKYEGSS